MKRWGKHFNAIRRQHDYINTRKRHKNNNVIALASNSNGPKLVISKSKGRIIAPVVMLAISANRSKPADGPAVYFCIVNLPVFLYKHVLFRMYISEDWWWWEVKTMNAGLMKNTRRAALIRLNRVALCPTHMQINHIPICVYIILYGKLHTIYIQVYGEG